MNSKIITSTIAFLLPGGMALSQGTVEDYKRAFSAPSTYQDKVFYSDVRPTWLSNGSKFWYVRNTPEGKIYVVSDATSGKKESLFDHKSLASALAAQSETEVNWTKLPLQNVRVSDNLDTVRFHYDKFIWNYHVSANSLTQACPVPPRPDYPHWMVDDDEKVAEPVKSPDGKYEAYIKNHNIYVRTLGKKGAVESDKQISFDGTLSNYYSAYIMWSPDSKKLVSRRIRPVDKRYVYYVESSPKDSFQPKLHKQEYAKPGDELPFKHPCLFDIETGKVIVPSTELFAQPYFIEHVRWNDNSEAITFEYNQRGHQLYRVLEVSATSGDVRTLIEESSNTFVNYSRRFRHDLNENNQIIWMSERDNHNHLYLYDRTSGKVINQITKGEWYVREVLKVDEKNKTIFFSANGINKDEDPYFIHYYSIDFSGRNMKSLTPGKGNHKAWFSPDYKYMVDTYSSVDTPPVTQIIDVEKNKVTHQLEKADITQLKAAGWRAPEPFCARGRDGKTDMWGIIVRPSNFDPSKRYPVIEYIYSGPGSHYTPKSFSPYYWSMSGIAELGFIVVQLDGMGTSFRSKAFEDVCYKNLKDAGFPDRLAWIKAAAAKYPEMDIENVGIFGGSAGGQESTAAVLQYPEFYKAAYSACGCHDNRMDKIWWNEQWMGYPLDESYEASSNTSNAHKLTRPLMLVVGEMDDNVDPASTMQLADALIRAGKNFELVVLPGVAHTLGESYGEHKRYDFFVKHLMHKDPPSWDKVK